MPTAIQVDETQFEIVASLRGVGKQVYDCVGTAWTFREPVAGLLTSRGVPTGIHGKGPFWASFNGSHVDGSAPVSAPSPDATKNVPWLKLVGTPTPNTTGAFSNAAFIQRIDTKGGVAPPAPAPPLPPGRSTTPPTTCSGHTSRRSPRRRPLHAWVGIIPSDQHAPRVTVNECPSSG